MANNGGGRAGGGGGNNPMNEHVEFTVKVSRVVKFEFRVLPFLKIKQYALYLLVLTLFYTL